MEKEKKGLSRQNECDTEFISSAFPSGTAAETRSFACGTKA